jgi:glutamate/tyrosine decarboxylase-like PLP-dependent enzyme
LIPAVRAEYSKQFRNNVDGGKAKLVEQWEGFGAPITEMPEDGWTVEALLQLMDKFAEMTNVPLQGKHMSGTIYSASLRPEDATAPAKDASKIGQTRARDLEDLNGLIELSKDLKHVYTHAFAESYLWNSLHGSEFGVGDYLCYQVVHMVANMFGANKDNVTGLITSGGTESLMTAIRSYRNWGVKNKGHKVGEGVVVCADTVHAAVLKAGAAYNVQVVLYNTNLDGSFDLDALRSKLRQFGNRVVAVVGSAPNYSIGSVDPIAEMAALAQEYGVGMHVDACLGGFIVNNLPHVNPNLLAIPGVTSLSTGR